MPIYSERFLQVVGDQEQGVFHVANGKRAVIRDVLVSYTSAGAAFALHVHEKDALVFNAPDSYATLTYDVRVVVYGGESFSMSTWGAGTAATVSGYLFDDPTGADGPPPGATYSSPSMPPPIEG